MRYYYTFTSKARDKEKDPTSSTVEDVGAGVSHASTTKWHSYSGKQFGNTL